MKQTKLARLEKSVESTLGTVDTLVKVLSDTKDRALTLISQTGEELDKAKAEYEAAKAKCTYLQKRCLSTTSFIDKILNQ